MLKKGHSTVALAPDGFLRLFIAKDLRVLWSARDSGARRKDHVFSTLLGPAHDPLLEAYPAPSR